MPPPSRARRLFAVCLLGLCLIALSACEWTDLIDGDDDDDNNANPDDNTPPATDTRVPGLSVAVSGSDFDTTLARTRRAISGRANIDTVVTVDHQDNARSVNRTLRPTTLILFDNPNRSSALIAADPRVVLDLPMRVLVYRDGAGRGGDADAGDTTNSDTGTATDNTPGTAQGMGASTRAGTTQPDNKNPGADSPTVTATDNVAVAYTNAAYLAARYNLDGAEAATLDAFEQDLTGIASDATGDTPSAGEATGVNSGAGIERVPSDDDFTTTLDQLTAAINDRDSLTLIETIDFQARDASRGLNPSTLLVFGNPDVGTRFMQSSQTAGVDLPQKMLVSADGSGNVTIYYNDPAFIADRHDIDNRADSVDAVAGLLARLANEAGGRPSDGDDGGDSADGMNSMGTDTGAMDPATTP